MKFRLGVGATVRRQRHHSRPNSERACTSVGPAVALEAVRGRPPRRTRVTLLDDSILGCSPRIPHRLLEAQGGCDSGTVSSPEGCRTNAGSGESAYNSWPKNLTKTASPPGTVPRSSTHILLDFRPPTSGKNLPSCDRRASRQRPSPPSARPSHRRPMAQPKPLYEDKPATAVPNPLPVTARRPTRNETAAAT